MLNDFFVLESGVVDVDYLWFNNFELSSRIRSTEERRSLAQNHFSQTTCLKKDPLNLIDELCFCLTSKG